MNLHKSTDSQKRESSQNQCESQKKCEFTKCVSTLFNSRLFFTLQAQATDWTLTWRCSRHWSRHAYFQLGICVRCRVLDGLQNRVSFFLALLRLLQDEKIPSFITTLLLRLRTRANVRVQNGRRRVKQHFDPAAKGHAKATVAFANVTVRPDSILCYFDYIPFCIRFPLPRLSVTFVINCRDLPPTIVTHRITLLVFHRNLLHFWYFELWWNCRFSVNFATFLDVKTIKVEKAGFHPVWSTVSLALEIRIQAALT